MDFKRITSGLIVAVALAIILLIPNNIITGILFTVIAIIAMNEYLKAISKVCKPIKWVAYVSCIIVAIINYIPKENLTNVLMYSIPTIILILFAHVIASDMKITFKDMAYTLLGICYIPVFIMFLSLIDGMNNGKILLGYVFMASWGTDVFAYCIGKRFGKHKFSKVSPKKSIEGCIGGTIGAVVAIVIYTYVINTYLGMNVSYIYIIGCSIILSLVGQIGDFAASSIKRFVDIKDYSNLIPGHGGMLDRIDSLIFLAPFAYALFMMI